MENRRIRHITLVFLFLLSSAGFSQLKVSEINNYRETISLSSSRHLFLSGESIEFHAEVLEQDTYKLSALSQNIRVELMNSMGNSIEKYNLKVEGGATSGYIIIPDQAPTGWYYLRAYTNWMRNIGPEGYATLAIKVFNPTDTELPLSREDAGELSVTLYPSGNGTAVFTGYGQEQGFPTKVYLLNSNQDTVSTFSTHESGWTNTEINLDQDETYSIKLDKLTQIQYSSIPKIVTGPDQKILIEDSGSHLSVSLSGRESSDNQSVVLIVHQSYTTYWESKELAMRDLNVKIPKKDLPAGIFQLSLFSSSNSILSKRLWSEYKPGRTKINLDNFPDSINLRSKNSVDLNMIQTGGRISVMVGFDEPKHPYLSHLPGLPGWNGTSLIPNEEKAFQAWLMGNSYPDEFILSILETRVERSGRIPEYLPETRSGLISGKVYDKNSGEYLSNIGISITILNNNHFDACRTDEHGHFYFALPGMVGTSDYIINFTSEIDSGMQIIVNPDYEAAMSETLGNFFLYESEIDYIKTINTNRQISNIYGLIPKFSKKQQDSIVDRVTFFYPPDQIIVLDEFIKLANVREIIYEVVPNVSVRKIEGIDKIRVNSDNSFDLSHTTLVLLDGIPLVNHSELLSLTPDRIKTIEVKNRTYVYGRNIYSAIINFVSPNEDYAGLNLPSSSVLSTIDIPVGEALIKSVNIKEGVNIPLLENILYWRKDISDTDGKISFSANDLAGIFRVYIYGHTIDGEWIFGTKTINVGRRAK